MHRAFFENFSTIVSFGPPVRPARLTSRHTGQGRRPDISPQTVCLNIFKSSIKLSNCSIECTVLLTWQTYFHDNRKDGLKLRILRFIDCSRLVECDDLANLPLSHCPLSSLPTFSSVITSQRDLFEDTCFTPLSYTLWHHLRPKTVLGRHSQPSEGQSQSREVHADHESVLMATGQEILRSWKWTWSIKDIKTHCLYSTTTQCCLPW